MPSIFFGLLASILLPMAVVGQSLRGTVTDAVGSPIERARITLFSPDTLTFYEARSDSQGRFVIGSTLNGSYRLGVAATGYRYAERSVVADGPEPVVDVTLAPENEKGTWRVVGDPGERLGGTNSAVLLPDGRIFYCHDTRDPMIFDPINERVMPAAESPGLQGCHAVTLLTDGRLLYVGGADRDVYGPGTRQVKTYDYRTNTWLWQPDLIDYRWYPSMLALADGRILAVGGGGLDNPVRVRTSEVMNPATMTWSATGSISIGNEVSPVALLHDGRVLMTHRPPQIYDPGNGDWELSADFARGPRMPNGDHSDHEIVVLPDGRVVAIGYKPFGPMTDSSFVEIYDPALDRWMIGAPFPPLRSRASIVTLPTKDILVMGGQKEIASDPTPTNQWDYMALTDLYNPQENTWRRLADLNIAREYHTTPILIPDGRVVTVGGEGAPGNEPDRSTIEIFSPPYLFRGIRPRITSLSSGSLAPGSTVSATFDRTAMPTSVMLMGASANTHFMESGPNRCFSLEFVAGADEVIVTIPDDPNLVPPGYYQLFLMVDDIPSVGQLISVSSLLSGVANRIVGDATIPRLEDLSKERSLLRHVRFTLPDRSDITLDILDALGRTWGESVRTTYSSGTHDAVIDVSDVPCGWYFYRLRAGDHVISYPFVLR